MLHFAAKAYVYALLAIIDPSNKLVALLFVTPHNRTETKRKRGKVVRTQDRRNYFSNQTKSHQVCSARGWGIIIIHAKRTNWIKRGGGQETLQGRGGGFGGFK